MSENQTYPVTYNMAFHSPALTAEQVPEGSGACDLLLTLAAQVDGNESLFASQSIDGSTGQPCGPDALFNIWQGFTRQLARDLPEGTGPQVLCAEVAEILDRAQQHAAEAAAPSTEEDA